MEARVIASATPMRGAAVGLHQPPLSFELLRDLLAARGQKSVEDWRVSILRAEHHTVKVQWFVPVKTLPRKVVGPEEEATASLATVALLGDEIARTWVQSIGVQKPTKSLFSYFIGRTTNACFHPQELPTRMQELIDEIDASLAESVEGFGHDESAFATFSLKPKLQNDYARRDDLMVANTYDKDFWKAANAPLPFSSRRYAKNGEVFVYLKVDEQCDRDRRMRIEAALLLALQDRSLSSGSLGTTLGGGTGKRYTYFDLLLTDLERAMPVIRETLKEHALPLRSWLLFFDADRKDDFIGLFEGAPAAPKSLEGSR